jgi:hypothetical protein
MCEHLVFSVTYTLTIILIVNVGCTSPRPASRQSIFNDFIGGKFLSFCEKYFGKECFIKNSTFKIKNYLKKAKKATKIATIAYSMKGCLRFFIFIF